MHSLMKYWEILKMAVMALIAHRLRTVLTLVGVIIGVTSVITIVSALEGMSQSIEAEINRLGPTTFIIARFGMVTSEEQFLEALKRKPLEYEYKEAIEKGCEECEQVAVRDYSEVDVKFRNHKLRNIPLIGSTSNFLDILDYELDHGRFHSPEDDNSHRRVVFIGAGVAEELYENTDPIGKTLKINNINYSIIGVAKKLGSTFGEDRDKVVFVPYSVYIKDFARDRHYHSDLSILVKARSLEKMDIAMDEVRVILRSYRHVPFNKDDDFSMMTAESIMSILNQTTKYIRFGLVGISSISLIVGGIIIMNIMMVSVTERTREIGIRKSIGARQKDILYQFLFEAIIVSLGGGLIGIALGMILGDLLIGLINMNVSPTLYAIGLGVGISTGVGLFFGIYPAMKAAKLQPVKALSFE